MSDLRTIIAAVIENAYPGKYGNALSLLTADAVIDVVASEYINSRGMFHEPDRCLGCGDCNE